MKSQTYIPLRGGNLRQPLAAYGLYNIGFEIPANFESERCFLEELEAVNFALSCGVGGGIGGGSWGLVKLFRQEERRWRRPRSLPLCLHH